MKIINLHMYTKINLFSGGKIFLKLCKNFVEIDISVKILKIC